MAGLMGMVALHAQAQDAASPGTSGRSFSIVPSLSVQETYTTNRLLTSTDPQSEFISQISPGLHITSTAGRIQGQLDYALNGYVYSKDSAQNNLQNFLGSRFKVEAVENWAFIDASANITRQSISALGTQSPDPALQASNQSQVGNYYVSPYVRGSLAGLAQYELRGAYHLLHSGSFSEANSKSIDDSLHLNSERSAGRLGWGLDLSQERVNYQQGRRTESNSVVASLNFPVLQELVLTARGGRESNNIETQDKEGTNTWGAGLDWRPSERTHVSLSRDKRYFGAAHAIDIDYRTPRTVWTYVDTKDSSSGSDAGSATNTGSTQTVYDLLFSQFASLQPDPLLRAQLVNNYLASQGLRAGSLVSGGFLTSAVSLTHRREFSVAMTGIRSTLILTAYQTQTSRLDPLATTTDDLSSAGNIKQRGLGATVSHRLTPDTSATASYMLLKSNASDSAAESDQRTLTMTWTERLGPHVNLSLSARRVLFKSSLSPYNESAVIAGLDFLF